MRHPKILPPLVFRKRTNHKSRNAQPQSEREPQNEARFADYAILGDRRVDPVLVATGLRARPLPTGRVK